MHTASGFDLASCFGVTGQIDGGDVTARFDPDVACASAALIVGDADFTRGKPRHFGHGVGRAVAERVIEPGKAKRIA